MLDPVWIVLIGIVIVLVGILALRLHAFLALTLAALAVATLTTPGMLQTQQLEKLGQPVLADRSNAGQVAIALEDPADAQAIGSLVIVRREGSRWTEVAEVRLLHTEQSPEESSAESAAESSAESSSVVGIGETLQGYEPQPGDQALPRRDWNQVQAKSTAIAPKRVAEAFGRMCGNVAILIAMAAIVGKCLLESGAADRIVRRALSFFGERNASIAFITSGFLLAIPVYFDTVFYLMIPLAKSLRLRTGGNYLLYVLALIVGGTMAHSLVPPTPGPLFMAEEFGIDLGLMIMAGCCVCVFTSIAGYFYSTVINHYWDLPLRETPDMTIADIAEMVARKDTDLPPLWLSLLPIVLPVLLIASVTVLKMAEVPADLLLMRVVTFLGDKNIALTIAAAISLAMLAWQKRGDVNLSKSVSAALATGGIIILITAAGGAFGAMLGETGITRYLAMIDSKSPLVLLLLAYLLTMTIRTVQGSATVAMLTTAGVLSSMASPEFLGFHPVYLALAIGCGSKPIMWMNDSGFWTMCKMSGMTDIEGLKSITPMTFFISVVGLIVTIAGAIVLPLV